MLRIAICLCWVLLASAAAADIQRVSELSFERVVLHGDGKLEIRQGAQSELAIKGSEKILETGVFYLDGDTLVLGRGGKRRSEVSGVNFKLTVQELTHLKLVGSGDIYIRPLEVEDLYIALEGAGRIKIFSVRAEDLTLRLSGSGDMQAVVLAAQDLDVVLSGPGEIHFGELVAENAEFSVKGSGDITVQKTGTLDSLDIKIVGSGDVDLKLVKSEEVEVNIMGSGEATVHAISELEVGIVGSGDVYYSGEPDIDQSILGSGDVHSRQARKSNEQRE